MDKGKNRVWEITVTSTDAALIESLSQPSAAIPIDLEPMRRFPGATETVLEILGVIRDASFDVFCDLAAAWLCQQFVTSSASALHGPKGEPLAPSTGKSSRSNSVRAMVSVRDVERSIEVDVNVEASSAREAATVIKGALRNAGIDG